jgi:hypothetical protein
MTATEEQKQRIRRALFEGANPRGFSSENAAINAEIQAEDTPKPEPAEVEVAPVVAAEEPKRRTLRRKRTKE